MRSGSIRESMQVTIATPACATPSKPPSVEVGGELPVGGDQVVEVTHDGTLAEPGSATGPTA